MSSKVSKENPSSSEIKEALSIGVMAGIAGQYVGNVVSNFLDKEPMTEVFVPDLGPAYYANVIAGGITGILALFLDTNQLIIAATILNQILIDLFIKLEKKPGYDSEELVYVIIRNSFSLIIILRIFEDITKTFLSEEESFDYLLFEAIIIGVIVNSSISVLNHFASLDDLREVCKRK